TTCSSSACPTSRWRRARRRSRRRSSSPRSRRASSSSATAPTRSTSSATTSSSAASSSTRSRTARWAPCCATSPTSPTHRSSGTRWWPPATSATTVWAGRSSTARGSRGRSRRCRTAARRAASTASTSSTPSARSEGAANTMTMLSKDEAQALLKKVIALSKAETCEANLNGNTNGNIRTARNSVSTSGVQEDLQLVVQSSYGKRVGTTTINELDDASLEKAVRRSEELAKLAPENPEFMPPLEPQQYVDAPGWVDATAKITPEYRAKGAADSINPSKEKKLVAAGFLQDFFGFQAMMNSKGLFAYYPSTNVNFTVTVRSEDGTGSGYAASDANDVAEMDTAKTSGVAIDKAIRSMGAKAIEPGKYTVILEPAASVGLLQFMGFGFDA